MRNKHNNNNYLKETLPLAAIVVASLGYFVDIYDLLLFSIVRLPSLKSLGLTGAEAVAPGIFLLNVQMAGLMFGGICWGILGDKKGRLTVLFGSILIYSVANIANAFVDSVNAYTLCRFIVGFGLAGELGAGITLVVELMPLQKRGYATTMEAGVGICGAIAAYFVAVLLDWRTAFLVGGALGFFVLLLRIGVSESGMFQDMKRPGIRRGDFLALFNKRKPLVKYLKCILIGLPLWFGVGILITLSPEFGKELNVKGAVNAGTATAVYYGGTVIGDICSGLLSQYLKSRIKVVVLFLTLTVVAIAAYLFLEDLNPFGFYTVCGFFGFAAGYWALFLTISAEQFGTNIRATVTTTMPNFVRGAVVPLWILFQWFRSIFNGSLVCAALVVGTITLILAFWAILSMKESFAVNLDYAEEL